MSKQEFLTKQEAQVLLACILVLFFAVIYLIPNEVNKNIAWQCDRHGQATINAKQYKCEEL